MGHHLTTVGERGPGRHQLSEPMDVCMFKHCDEECFMVSDSVNACIKVFNRTGSCVEIFGDRSDMFRYPYGVCVSRDQHVIVTDICKQAIVVLSFTGNKIAQFGQYGCGPRYLDNPYCVTTDPDNNVVVSDSGNMAVKIFTQEGTLLHNFTVEDFHIFEEDFVMLQGITTDPDGNILVVANNNVYVMANNGRFWEVLLPSCGLVTPKGLAVSPLGHLVITQDSKELDNLIALFRYPMENFRALKAVTKPTSENTPHHVPKLVKKPPIETADTIVLKPTTSQTPLELTEQPEIRPGCVSATIISGAKIVGSREVNIDVNKKQHVTFNRQLTCGQDYFLGPKRGVSRRHQPKTTARHHTSVIGDLPMEIETYIDRQLRDKRRLKTRPDKHQSPAHIFSFS